MTFNVPQSFWGKCNNSHKVEGQKKRRTKENINKINGILKRLNNKSKS